MRMKKLICLLTVAILLVSMVGCAPISDIVEEEAADNRSTNTDDTVTQEAQTEESGEATQKATEEVTQEAQTEQRPDVLGDIQNINQSDELLQYMNQYAEVSTTEEMDAMVERLEQLWELTISDYDEDVSGLMLLSDNTVQQMMDNYNLETRQIDSTKIVNFDAIELIDQCQQSGFRFGVQEGYLYIEENYSVLEPYTTYMSEKMAKYIALVNEARLNPYAQDGMICINWNELALRVGAYEEYLMNVDETNPKIQTLYRYALLAWLTGMDNSPIIDMETHEVNAETMQSYEAYPFDTPTEEIVSEWVEYLETHDSQEIYNDGLYNQVNVMIDRHLGDITNQSACVYEEIMADDSHKHVIVEMTYPEIFIKDNQAASDAINQQIRGEVEASANWVIEAAEMDFEDEEELEFMPTYGSYSSFSVEQNSQGILSIRIIYSDYLGGAHGNYGSVAYNYNTKTGEAMNIEDLFVDGYNYNQKIIDEVTRQIEASEDLSEVYWAEGLPDYQIFFTEGYIAVIYTPYVIGPYAAGEPTFYIPYSYFEDGLR